MVDNLEKILPLLKFETKDDFYYLQILERKKEIEDRQLEQIRDLDIIQKDYHESVDELIHRYVETSAGCEYGEYERFKQDLERLKKPTS